jgi:uncharacterized protein (TIGR03086 family)
LLTFVILSISVRVDFAQRGFPVDSYEAMEGAQAEFERRLQAVTKAQWDLPTPCDEWSVYDLVNHVVVGARAYARMLEGCTREESIAIFASNVIDDDPFGSFQRHALEVNQAFRQPGSLERVCHHPYRDFPAADLIGIRMADDLIHTWDLAHAVGGDEHLDDDLVREAWRIVEPILPALPATGDFAAPSGEVDDSISLQARLLNAVGRRALPRTP